MKEKKDEERAATSGGEKPAPAKTEKSEKQPEAPKKPRENGKSPPKRNQRIQQPHGTSRSRSEETLASEGASSPWRGKNVYIKLNKLHAFKNHSFDVRDEKEMRVHRQGERCYPAYYHPFM
ncbi:hypothetical protein [Pseudoflavonifractor sp. An187]|uniref:hypothetical protein n=1 Tax=Pseudoflavonifractor sp. An187 TaxID=1965578 RepID=UPI001FA90F20|nr:hypothetical protein [Pseudoflavonifractor sp. An187]